MRFGDFASTGDLRECELSPLQNNLSFRLELLLSSNRNPSLGILWPTHNRECHTYSVS